MSLLGGSELLHRRVARAIADEIAAGGLAPGERLPSERELGERLGVSRATVRRALRELAAKGLVESHVGRGSFVAAGPIGEAPNALMSFTELGASRGLATSARVLAARTRPATLDEAELLAVAPGAPLFELERLRLLDGIPLSLDASRVPLALAPGLPDVDFGSASLYATLEAAGRGPSAPTTPCRRSPPTGGARACSRSSRGRRSWRRRQSPTTAPAGPSSSARWSTAATAKPLPGDARTAAALSRAAEAVSARSRSRHHSSRRHRRSGR